MKLKHLFYFNAILLIPGSLALLIVPAVMLGRAGFPADNPEILQLGSNTGGLLLFVGLVAWFAARVEDNPLRRNVRLSFFVMNLVMAVAHFIAFLNGGLINAAILHGILALAYGYFQFIKPDA